MMDYGLYDGGNVGPWCPPPGVSFCESPKHEVKVATKPDISLDIVSQPPKGDRPSFMGLPLEIRLSIYRWVHLMGPVRHAELAPWYPSPVPTQYLMRSLLNQNPIAAESARSSPGVSSANRLLRPTRPLSGLPSALLRANRQIYGEARVIPFAQNEFVFMNWFSSGLWAARAFTRSLRPWQTDALRWVRLEIMERDLRDDDGSSQGLREWVALCGVWAAGVRGLRLKMVGGRTVGEEREKGKESVEAGDVAEGLLPGRKWEDGLVALRRLERLEIELEMADWRDEDKISWCRQLGERMRARGSTVEVVCTERVKEKSQWLIGSGKRI